MFSICLNVVFFDKYLCIWRAEKIFARSRFIVNLHKFYRVISSLTTLVEGPPRRAVPACRYNLSSSHPLSLALFLCDTQKHFKYLAGGHIFCYRPISGPCSRCPFAAYSISFFCVVLFCSVLVSSAILWLVEYLSGFKTFVTPCPCLSVCVCVCVCVCTIASLWQSLWPRFIVSVINAQRF